MEKNKARHMRTLGIQVIGVFDVFKLVGCCKSQDQIFINSEKNFSISEKI
jgi:hypothetical protein